MSKKMYLCVLASHFYYCDGQYNAKGYPACALKGKAYQRQLKIGQVIIIVTDQKAQSH